MSPSSDGNKRPIIAANTESLLRIIQSVPSTKAEPFKRWLAKVGYERLEEIENPVLDAADGLPSRAALARELLRYKMEDYSENGFCASWLVDLEFELWEAADRDSPPEDEMFMVNTSRECDFFR